MAIYSHNVMLPFFGCYCSVSLQMAEVKEVRAALRYSAWLTRHRRFGLPTSVMWNSVVASQQQPNICLVAEKYRSLQFPVLDLVPNWSLGILDGNWRCILMQCLSGRGGPTLPPSSGPCHGTPRREVPPPPRPPLPPPRVKAP